MSADVRLACASGSASKKTGKGDLTWPFRTSRMFNTKLNSHECPSLRVSLRRVGMRLFDHLKAVSPPPFDRNYLTLYLPFGFLSAKTTLSRLCLVVGGGPAPGINDAFAA